MELIARNFELFPKNTTAYRELCPLLLACKEVRFPYSIGETNSNQFTFGFDDKLKTQLIACGAVETQLEMPAEIKKEYDFAFLFAGRLVVVEVEKANREKILYDYLKFHMYLKSGADFSILFLTKNYAHRLGEWDLFDWGVKRYRQCLEFGFGNSKLFDRILLVGYEQCTVEGTPLNSRVRASLIATRRTLKAE